MKLQIYFKNSKHFVRLLAITPSLLILFTVPPAFAEFECAMDKTVSGFDAIYLALGDFKKACGRYPLTKEGLKALKNLPQNLKCSSIGKYSDAFFFEDGWFKPLNYTSNGKTFRVKASHGYYLTEKSPKQNYAHRWSNAKPIKLCEEMPSDIADPRLGP